MKLFRILEVPVLRVDFLFLLSISRAIRLLYWHTRSRVIGSWTHPIAVFFSFLFLFYRKKCSRNPSLLTQSLSNEYFLGQVLETCPTMLFMDSNLILIWAAGTTNQGMVEQWFFSRVFANISTGMIWEKQVRSWDNGYKSRPKIQRRKTMVSIFCLKLPDKIT